MVATKIYEVTSKGTEWARGGGGSGKKKKKSNITGDSRGSGDGSVSSVSSRSSQSSPPRPRPTSPLPSPSAAAAAATAGIAKQQHRQQQQGNRRRSSTGSSWLASLTGGGGRGDFYDDLDERDYGGDDDDDYYVGRGGGTGGGAGGGNHDNNYNSSRNSYYHNNPVSHAVEASYSVLAGIVSSFLYRTDSIVTGGTGAYNADGSVAAGAGSGGGGGVAAFFTPPWGSNANADAALLPDAGGGGDDSTAPSYAKKPSSSFTRHMTSNDLASLLFQNPYNSVRGRGHAMQSSSSLSAVRSLLTVLPKQQHHPSQLDVPSLRLFPDEVDSAAAATTPTRLDRGREKAPSYGELDDIDMTEVEYVPNDKSGDTKAYHPHRRPSRGSVPWVSSSETASQVAEGTIRALRDLALDEAVELHIALRFWTERWERPVLSWLEAGPRGKYNQDGQPGSCMG